MPRHLTHRFTSAVRTLSTMRASRSLMRLATVTLSLALPVRVVQAQWSTTYETFYLQAPHNWVFRNNYQAADRLFNAFDYGHAILYEKLWTQPGASVSGLEDTEYNKLTRQILVRPPRVPLAEAAIEVQYAKLAPEAKAMFDWSHILHRQIYDVLGDERLDQAAKDREVTRLVAYYRTRTDLAFSSKPKSMKLMQEQPYSLAFRKNYPKFNGLIWGYHWLQVGLYEPLIVGKTSEARQAGVRATVARFWQMLEDPLTSLPYQMPMTAAVAPKFSERYPEAAIIFDNLHSMHDVVSDILANPAVPRNRKRVEILLAAQRFRDDTSYVMTVAAWRNMAFHMGIENMGGPAVGSLGIKPTPSVTRGAVMQHDDATGAMIGFAYGSGTAAHGGMAHGAMPGMAATEGAMPGMSAAPAVDHAAMGHAATPATATPVDHTAMGHAAVPATTAMPAKTAMPVAGMTGMADMEGMHDSGTTLGLQMRMMHDATIRRRVMRDPAMRRMMLASLATAPPEHRAMIDAMLRVDSLALRGTRRMPQRAKGKSPQKATKPAMPAMNHGAGGMAPMKP